MLVTERSLDMCEDFEWLAWQHEAERRAEHEKTDQLKKQAKAATPGKPVEPEKFQEDPVPA